ncbi:hypothetical protein [Phenylobacterium sp.]|uniref:hypothetical protein n=1 Tax=Phenylobacterium sp. TaxID=1871053 RepID=UPI002E36735E|nr:hypothetical protein [Phenylobacterium sp.]HEX2560685.1 hypothetical protein [Phenylobacterium sp.]
MDQLLLIAYKRGGRWVLLNEQARELGHYSREDEIIQAAESRLQSARKSGALLLETREGWREQVLAVA